MCIGRADGLYRFNDGRFGFVFRENGRRIKRRYTTRAKALVEAEKAAIRINNGQRETASFSQADREIYLHAQQLVEPHDISPIAALHEWQEWRAKNQTREIYVSRFISKVQRDRDVPINDTLAACLADYRDKTGPVCTEDRPDRETARLGTVFGFPWIPDGLRHSFGSYWQSQHRNIEKLAEIMGNSILGIRRHYYNPRPEAAARKWFAVWPVEGVKELPLELAFA